MSDGSTDAMNYIATAVDDYLESLVRYYEHYAIPEFTGIITNALKDKIDHSAPIMKELRRSLAELLKIEPIFMMQVMHIRNYDKFTDSLIFPHLELENLFLLLQANGKISKLIRLQKATQYRDRLLIFTDENWQILPNGIHFQSPQKFVDGEQDVLLGFWKQRCSSMRSAPVDRRLPLMIVGSKSYSRKNWKLVTAFQPIF